MARDGTGREDTHSRRTTAGVAQRSDAGAAQPEPGVGSEDRPGLAVAQLKLHPPTGDHAERVVPLRRDHLGTRATAQRERPHRDYSVPSAGRRSGSPSRGNWSSWKMMISVIAPPVIRRTSIVSGRYAPSCLRQW